MRRISYLALFLLVAFASTSCTSLQPVTSFKPDTVVLEISTRASGNVYPKEGTLIDMRLYESGRFEYEDYAEQSQPNNIPGKVAIIKKEARLNAEDVKELTGLAEQPDFLAAKEQYPALHMHIDDYWYTTIIFTHEGRKKEIVAVNFWDMRYYKADRLKYPPSMVKLLERAAELKARAISGS